MYRYMYHFIGIVTLVVVVCGSRQYENPVSFNSRLISYVQDGKRFLWYA
jgi:hypothetical protein